MHRLYELKELLLDEMKEYGAKDKLTAQDVEAVKYLTGAADHLCNVIERCEEDGTSYAMGGRGGSYARGRRGNVRRDAMGRYSRDGYSRAEDDFMTELRELMQDAPNDRIRQKMQEIARM